MENLHVCNDITIWQLTFLFWEVVREKIACVPASLAKRKTQREHVCVIVDNRAHDPGMSRVENGLIGSSIICSLKRVTFVNRN